MTLRKRPSITREQLQYCKDHAMSASQAGTFLGRHHTTILSACKKFGIELPKYAHRYAAPIRVKFRKVTVTASDEKKLTWSCSPAAIARALAKKPSATL